MCGLYVDLYHNYSIWLSPVAIARRVCWLVSFVNLRTLPNHSSANQIGIDVAVVFLCVCVCVCIYMPLFMSQYTIPKKNNVYISHVGIQINLNLNKWNSKQSTFEMQLRSVRVFDAF